MPLINFFCIFALALSLINSQGLALSLQQSDLSRRNFGQRIAVAASGAVLLPNQAQAASLSELQGIAQKARNQLDPVPTIIQNEEWDKVRAILITPPISDFWTASKRPVNIMTEIADAVSDAGGDELNILELREELQSHLRYLDMAVYNNVFNPITREGTTGATKELVRSYYEDPKNELKASISAFEGVLKEIGSTLQ